MPDNCEHIIVYVLSIADEILITWLPGIAEQTGECIFEKNARGKPGENVNCELRTVHCELRIVNVSQTFLSQYIFAPDPCFPSLAYSEILGCMICL